MLRIIADLDRVMAGVIDPILKEDGLGREHWQLLRLLADGQGRSMGQISEVLGLPGSTSTRVVDFLAERMLVHRRSDPLDRRRVLVHVSEAGQEALERVEEAFRQRAASALVRRSESTTLASLLDRFAVDADGPVER